MNEKINRSENNIPQNKKVSSDDLSFGEQLSAKMDGYLTPDENAKLVIPGELVVDVEAEDQLNKKDK